MAIFNISNPLTLLLMLVATGLLIFLAQELKKSYISVIPLVFYLVLLIVHVIQLITFFAYLWVDDIEAKKLGKKSVDNSLDWFWKSV